MVMSFLAVILIKRRPTILNRWWRRALRHSTGWGVSLRLLWVMTLQWLTSLLITFWWIPGLLLRGCGGGIFWLVSMALVSGWSWYPSDRLLSFLMMNARWRFLTCDEWGLRVCLENPSLSFLRMYFDISFDSIQQSAVWLTSVRPSWQNKALGQLLSAPIKKTS